MTFLEEVKRRRTFAIISHPDAGKTTLTEKLLLYGGAIHLAGSVKSRKTQKYAVSDWMEIENQLCTPIRLRRLPRQYLGHPGSPGLLGRYVSYIDGCRQCRHAHRRSERRGSSDEKTLCRL